MVGVRVRSTSLEVEVARNGLLREDTPYALRIAIAAGASALAVVGWLTIINGSREITITSVILGVMVLVAAFLALGVLRTPRFPLLPFWTSLAISILWSSLMMASIAAPPHWGSLTFLGAVVVLSLATGITVSRRLGIGRALILAVGALGVYGVAVVPVAVWKGGGPLISGTGAPVAVLGAACVASIWHALRVRSENGGAAENTHSF
jgi:hypothetical protein